MESLPSREEIERMRPLARERIKAGELPATTQIPWEYPTSSEKRLDPNGCRVCKRQIAGDELYWCRLDLPVSVKPELHIACHSAWQVEVEVRARVPVELMLLRSTRDFVEGDEYKHNLAAVEGMLTAAADLTCQPRECPIDWGDAWGCTSTGYAVKLTALGVHTLGCALVAWIGRGTQRAAIIKLNGHELRMSSIEQVWRAMGTAEGQLPPNIRSV